MSNCQAKFFQFVYMQQISHKEYEHVFEVWDKFEMKMIKDYDNLYLKFDVSLLADVFEKFRNSSFKFFGSCPSHYLSALTLTWDPKLNVTKVELDLISDADIYLIIEKSIRSAFVKHLNI